MVFFTEKQRALIIFMSGPLSTILKKSSGAVSRLFKSRRVLSDEVHQCYRKNGGKKNPSNSHCQSPTLMVLGEGDFVEG